MKRTKYQNRLPDARNCSTSKNFTIIPNEIIKNPNLTGKAKTILSILLSNQTGWTSYISVLLKNMKERIDAVRNGIKELEENGYLIRFKYRDKKTKKYAGSFWAYTDNPYKFNLEESEQTLERSGFELIIKKKENTDNPYMENPYMEKPRLIILNNNNTNNKKIYTPEKIPESIHGKKILSKKEIRIHRFLPIAKVLGNAIQKNKNKKIPLKDIERWAYEISKLETKNEISFERIKKVLRRYSREVKSGGYNIYPKGHCPVAYCGSSFCSKFNKIEDYFERENQKNVSGETPTKQTPCKKANPKTLVERTVWSAIQEYTDKFNIFNNGNGDQDRLYHAYNGLHVWMRDIDLPSFEKPSPVNVMRDFLEWLQQPKQDWIDSKPYPEMIDPNKKDKIFTKFLKYYNKETSNYDWWTKKHFGDYV